MSQDQAVPMEVGSGEGSLLPSQASHQFNQVPNVQGIPAASDNCEDDEMDTSSGMDDTTAGGAEGQTSLSSWVVVTGVGENHPVPSSSNSDSTNFDFLKSQASHSSRSSQQQHLKYEDAAAGGTEGQNSGTPLSGNLDLKALEQHLPAQLMMQSSQSDYGQQHQLFQQTMQSRPSYPGSAVITQPQKINNQDPSMPGHSFKDSTGDAEGQNSRPSLSDMKNLNQMDQTHNLDLKALEDSLTSSTKNQDSRPTLDDLKIQNNPSAKTPNPESDEANSTVGDNSQASAPQDIGRFIVNVDWKGDFPDKWEKKFEKALQSWLSKLKEKASVHDIKLKDDLSVAEVQITPSTDFLKKGCTMTLKFKQENKDVLAQINLDKTYSGSQNTSALDKNKAQLSKVNSEAEDTISDALNGTTNTAEATSDTSVSFTVPLYQYWFMHNAYRKELDLIEKNLGVSIEAEVSVSIKPIKSSKSLSKASEDFQNLVQQSVGNYSDAAVKHEDMDSDIMKEILRTIQLEEAKMMFTKSAGNCLIFGPKKFTDMIKREVGTTRVENKFNDRSFSMDVDNKAFSQSRPSLDMNTQDLQTQLEVEKVYWDLMKLSYEEQLSQIEAKYGVSFNADNLQGNVVQVQAQSKGVQHVNLEGHAVRALTHLYQKLASAAVSCELRKAADQTDVSSVVEKLQQRYCVVAAERLSRWRLTGLPEHLGPAIAETENILQRKVFDEKMKKLIGYSEDIPHARGIKPNLMPDYGAGAAGGPDLYKGVNFKEKIKTEADFSEDLKGNSGHDSKDADAEEETCAICMDSFTDKEKLKCGHEFCRECLKQSVESLGSICPVCKEVFGKLEGNQPDGTMKVTKRLMSLPGYSHCGSIEIYYDIPSGTQTKKHPNPGNPYHGTTRHAYLPDNDEGKEVLALLQRAFDQKLIFTVGTSTTTGVQNAVTWNDIHHKTNTSGGPERYGYPDPNYLKRVKDELKAKGIE